VCMEPNAVLLAYVSNLERSDSLLCMSKLE